MQPSSPSRGAPIQTKPIVDDGDLADNIRSWSFHLRALDAAERTQELYLSAARELAAFLAAEHLPLDVAEIRRQHVEAFVADQLKRWKPATAANKYRSLQQFFRWLLEEEEIEASPMVRMRPPRVPAQPVPVLGDDTLRALLLARIHRRSGLRGL